jgi:hypothetical protein
MPEEETSRMVAVLGLFPLAAMLLLLFAAAWLHDARREREAVAAHSLR